MVIYKSHTEALITAKNKQTKQKGYSREIGKKEQRHLPTYY